MCNTYVNIKTGEELNLKKVTELKDNAMLKFKPELWSKWDFEKNNELGLNVYEVTKAVDNHAYWYCEFCEESYLNKIKTKSNQANCNHCSIKNLNHLNSLYFTNSDLAKEWHPTLNGKLTSYDVLKGSEKKVWWLGECGHEWNAIVNSRVRGTGCPYCSNQKVLIGYNDMWTTNPNLAKRLLNPEDGYKYMQGTTKRVDFKCTDCGEVVKKRKINDVRLNGFVCGICGDKKSMPEKVMFNLLQQLNVEFDHNIAYRWSENKKYDFIIKNSDMIIEVHGGQHYFNGFKHFNRRTLEEEQENDKLKRSLALSNGIDNYIEIDAKYSNFEYIKKSILNSSLNDLFDLSNVNWAKINEKCLNNSILKGICKDWNECSDLEMLLNKYKISRDKLYKILKLGDKLDLCNFSEEFVLDLKTANTRKRVMQFDRFNNLINTFNSANEASEFLGANASALSEACRKMTEYHRFYWVYEDTYNKKKSKVNFYKKRNRGNVLQLDSNLNIVNEWRTCNEAYRYLSGKEDGNDGAISNCCNFKANTAYGYKWLYKEDYEDMKNGIKEYRVHSDYKFTTEVVQLSLDEKFIRKWGSIKEGAEALNVKSSGISAVCREVNDTCYGFKWMYLNEYERMRNKERSYRIKPKKARTRSIVQLSESMKYIKEWESMVTAGKELNISKNTICKACKNGKLINNYIWMYKEDYDKYILEQKQLA